ncbi:hypothetical protein CON65_14415 [Bacillus pseudomycoides]|uniref:Uncharacterized protein n=1 Tax=Bacillus pseudomycoides TaxID=64104 RepID=A0AA91VB68_9BACI|nr:hypothetical protein COO03_25200 [Bacillus sp. AFS098217]PED81962.1 hypothetical protein CON65_14415 [Bacillus pseudomycoides]PEU09148.1 hypothetical protein CN525_25170 [Bacillus sp. AFS014408]PEU13653.1 hypothetical protein CN524_11120 [Bacillus sp. AFS019443]PFW60083.1 hypothetical protein COL20_23055 [Bacillus sp. AFS075034]
MYELKKFWIHHYEWRKLESYQAHVLRK